MRIRSIRSSPGKVNPHQSVCSSRTRLRVVLPENCSESRLKAARRLGRIKSSVVTWRLGERGFSIVGGCLTLAAVSAAIALASLMHKISLHTAVQIEMDRCTGQYAIELRSAILGMDESFKRFKIARAAWIAACLVPGGCPPATDTAKAYLAVEHTIQTALELYWNTKMFSWKAPLFLTCTVPHLVMRSSFPEFPFQKISGTIEDFEHPVNSSPSQNAFYLNLKHKNLISTAEVKEYGQKNWKVKWTE